MKTTDDWSGRPKMSVPSAEHRLKGEKPSRAFRPAGPVLTRFGSLPCVVCGTQMPGERQGVREAPVALGAPAPLDASRVDRSGLACSGGRRNEAIADGGQDAAEILDQSAIGVRNLA